MKKAIRIWRNGTQGPTPLLFAFIRFLPFCLLLGAFYFWRFWLREGYSTTLLVVAISIFVFTWLVTIFVQLRPLILIKENSLCVNNYGLFTSDISLGNVKEVKWSGLGPLGVILDIRTKAGLSVREFGFLAKVSKSDFVELFSDYGIEVS